MILVAQKTTMVDKGPGLYLYGNYVTPEFHEAVTALMADTYTDSPVYKARTKANAFFQGGYSEPTGKFVFIEFWSHDFQNYDPFVEMVDEAYQKVRVPELEMITIAYSEENLKLADEISGQSNTPYTRQGDSIVFTPSLSPRHRRICEYFYQKQVLSPV